MKSNSNKYKQIQQLISQKKFNESLTCIEKNKKDLSKLDYFFLKSVAHRYLHKYSKALILLSEVNKISPTYGRSYQEFGHNYVKLIHGGSRTQISKVVGEKVLKVFPLIKLDSL